MKQHVHRFCLTDGQAEIAERYSVTLPYAPDEMFPPPELFPRRPAWVVREEEGARRLGVMMWGVPVPAKNAKGQPIVHAGAADFRCPDWNSGYKLHSVIKKA